MGQLRIQSLPLEHLSASSLFMAMTCPEKFRRRYLLKEPESFFSGRFLGIVDHTVHEENFMQKINTHKDLDLDWMTKRYPNVWQETMDENEPEWLDDDPLDLYERGLNMMRLYHSTISPKIQPVNVEKRFETVITGVPVPIIGYVDVQTHDRLIERKTSKTRLSKPKPEWRFQAKIYQMASDLPTEFHVIAKKKTPEICTPETDEELFMEKGNVDATVRMIQQSALRLNDLYERYGPDQPWPYEGLSHPFACNFCSYQQVCGAWRVGDPEVKGS